MLPSDNSAQTPETAQTRDRRLLRIRVVVWTLLSLLALAGWLRPGLGGLGLPSSLLETSSLSPSAPAASPAVSLAGRKPYPCLSYAPFRRSEWRPDRPGLIIAPDVIERDLEQIATVSSCVRVYGTANGLDVVPAIARRLGLRVWLGVWLGSDVSLNAAEMTRARALLRADVKQHPEADGVIDRVIVGSEVLLRGDLTVPELVGYLQEMQQHTSVPVAYADVWEFWLQHAQVLSPQVDEAVIHILPYWENSPVALPLAVDHVFDVWRRVGKTLAPLPVLVGETGWPAAGRQRGGAKPGQMEQQQFVQAVIKRLEALQIGQSGGAAYATDHARPANDEVSRDDRGNAALPPVTSLAPALNIIEAFNQPWKTASEGVAGSAWGVLDSDRQSGPDTVFAKSGGGMFLALFCVTGLMLMSGALRHFKTAWHWSFIGQTSLFAIWLSLLLVLPLRELMGIDVASTGGLMRAAALVFFWAWGLAEARHVMCVLWPHESEDGKICLQRLRQLQWLRETGLWGIAMYALLLVHDGRYMDLAWPLLAMPALPWVLSVWMMGSVGARARLTVARAGLLAGSSVAIMQVEGWSNGAAVAVSMLVLLLAVTSVKRAVSEWESGGMHAKHGED